MIQITHKLHIDLSKKMIDFLIITCMHGRTITIQIQIVYCIFYFLTCDEHPTMKCSFIESVGWDPKLVNESYPWIEDQIVHQPQLTEWQESVRDGLLEIGVSPFNGFTYDHMYGTKVGGTIFDRFGRRHSAAELLATANPDNLRVLVHATVHKIVFDTKGEKPKAVGVVFKDENGNRHRAVLSKKPKSEVIVSSGAIGSPQLLLLSGVGPKAELERLNIPVVVDNKFVGKQMADNPLNMIFVPMNADVKPTLIQTVGITKLGVYIEASNGFAQKSDSIHCDHGLGSAEVKTSRFLNIYFIIL